MRKRERETDTLPLRVHVLLLSLHYPLCHIISVVIPVISSDFERDLRYFQPYHRYNSFISVSVKG